MNILLLLIPISLLLIGVAIWAFAWAVRRGQFEDLDAAALDVLVDEGPVARVGARHGIASPDRHPTPSPKGRGASSQEPPR